MRRGEIRQRLLLDIKNLMTPAGYLNAGFPGYDTLFGRDALISALQLLPIMPEVARDTLVTLARWQATEPGEKNDAKPGAILHEYRFSIERQQLLPYWEWPYYGSVDATSLFLILLGEYVKQTNDYETLTKLWPNAVLAMQWHLDNAAQNPYGFITYERKNPQGLFHQGWKDSLENHLKIDPPVAIIEEQGYAYGACVNFTYASTFVESGETQIVNEARELALRIKTNFKPLFWMEDEKYFAIALDGNHNQRKMVASNPGHLLMCYDFLDKDSAHNIIKRLQKPDMWTIGGIRTLSDKDPDFDAFSYHLGSIWPHDNWIIYRGCRMWGCFPPAEQMARRIKRALFRAYKTLAVPSPENPRRLIYRIPELYTVVREEDSAREKIVPIEYANPLQAWAICALLNMLCDE